MHFSTQVDLQQARIPHNGKHVVVRYFFQFSDEPTERALIGVTLVRPSDDHELFNEIHLHPLVRIDQTSNLHELREILYGVASSVRYGWLGYGLRVG